MSKPAQKKELSSKRKHIRRQGKDAKVLFAQIGEIVWAWNFLHGEFYGWFENLLGENSGAAKHLWETAGSDTQQRKLLKALLEGIPSNEYHEDVKWVIEEADTLAQYRNSFVHTNFYYDFENNRVELLTRTSRANYVSKLTDIRRRKLFIPLRNDIIALSQRLLITFLCKHAARTLQERPSLEAFPSQKAGTKKKNRLGKQTKPPRPPQSSDQ